MKLKNKLTGEISDVNVKTIEYPNIPQGYPKHKLYNSLAELNEEWEDYHEEPKEYWYIDDAGIIQIDQVLSSEINMRKSIGNYFETKEEAGLAVRKLKAWKRLKDKGFKFDGWNGTEIGSNISYISELYYEGCADDMDLLFGGEE